MTLFIVVYLKLPQNQYKSQKDEQATGGATIIKNVKKKAGWEMPSGKWEKEQKKTWIVNRYE